ncbi:YSIRK-type signal peptide-containing protein [Carnobacterium divergens]|uniref:YSIRK-type signal peptide-containing protein n=1 Tax=Carnobacterium divergens TaxID=2748 RepID=UPI0010738B86|nr:YSIRK-type signal peptide-containing protein [Carnobacterium divergens]
MVSKNNKKILTEKNSNKVTKYKLKKFKVGLTSVAVGSLMFVGVGQVDVLAAETNIVDKVVVSESLEKAVVEVNKTDLTYTIKSVGNILASEKDYTVESFNTLVAAFDAATAVYDNEEATQADADQANVALQSAVESLEKAVVEVNKTDLTYTIKSVGNILASEKDYTVESFNTLVAAFDAATAVYDNEEATQADADQANVALQSAVESLEKAVVEVNKTDLYDVIISVGNIVTHENDFTVESFDNMGNAFDAATTVYDNKNATQAEVDQVKTDLQSAIEALEKAVVVDKADLYDVIISVGNIVTHENDFTVESFENVVNAHDAATTVYDNKNATQAEVDQAKTDLQSAIEALEKAEKSTDLPLPELEPSKPTAPEVTVDDKKESIDPTLEESEPLKPVKSEVSAALEAKKTEKNEGEMLPKTSTATFSLGALGLVSLFGGAVSSFKKK